MRKQFLLLILFLATAADVRAQAPAASTPVDLAKGLQGRVQGLVAPASSDRYVTHCYRTSGTSLKGVLGLVRDSNGNALGYATITFQDGRSMLADSTGIFQVGREQLPATLRFSYAGYVPVTVHVTRDTVLLVEMAQGADMAEVVVQASCFLLRRGWECSWDNARVIFQKDSSRTARFAIMPSKAAVAQLVYPNPTRGAVHLAGAPNLQQLQLLDGNGRLLRTWSQPFKGDAGTVSLDGFPAGSYLLRMMFRDGHVHAETLILLR